MSQNGEKKKKKYKEYGDQLVTISILYSPCLQEQNKNSPTLFIAKEKSILNNNFLIVCYH